MCLFFSRVFFWNLLSFMRLPCSVTTLYISRHQNLHDALEPHPPWLQPPRQLPTRVEGFMVQGLGFKGLGFPGLESKGFRLRDLLKAVFQSPRKKSPVRDDKELKPL